MASTMAVGFGGRKVQAQNNLLSKSFCLVRAWSPRISRNLTFLNLERKSKKGLTSRKWSPNQIGYRELELREIKRC
jgi:hypothetical protein